MNGQRLLYSCTDRPPHPDRLSEQDVQGGVTVERQLQPHGMREQQAIQDAEGPRGAALGAAHLLHLKRNKRRRVLTAALNAQARPRVSVPVRCSCPCFVFGTFFFIVIFNLTRCSRGGEQMELKQGHVKTTKI